MKNKGLIVGIGVGLLIVFVGFFVFLYLRDPEILTKSPSEIISGGIFGDNTEEIKEPSSSVMGDLLDPVGDCLVVSSSNCANVSFLRKADGTRFNGVIGFSDVPVGSKVYAPISGYIHILSSGEGDRSLVELIITENKNWSSSDQSGRYIVFSAKEFELLETDLKDDQPFVEKGKAFAKVTNNAELFPGFYDREQVLLVAFDKEWRDMLDGSITDVKEYVLAAIEKLN